MFAEIKPGDKVTVANWLYPTAGLVYGVVEVSEIRNGLVETFQGGYSVETGIKKNDGSCKIIPYQEEHDELEKRYLQVRKILKNICLCDSVPKEALIKNPKLDLIEKVSEGLKQLICSSVEDSLNV